MKAVAVENRKRAVRSRSTESKADAVSKARLFLHAEATRQQAMSIWLAVKPEKRIEAAIELFRADEVSLERAAEIAGLNRWVFQDILFKRGVKIVVETGTVAELDLAATSLRKYL